MCACVCVCVSVCVCVNGCECVGAHVWHRVREGAPGESDDMQIFTLGVSAELHGIPFH